MSIGDNNKALLGRYSITIEWSDEDDVYVVTFPEFPSCHTHGATREEALKNAQEVLELLIEANEEWEQPLPPPKLYNTPSGIENATSGAPSLDEYQRVS
jgi:predicted RNase H-like HicB family nuclease